MKTIFATLAALAIAAPAMADLPNRVIRSNVPAVSGSADGFLVIGEGYFVAEASADRITVDATVVPASVDVRDQGEVAAYLSSIGLNNVTFVVDRLSTGCGTTDRDPDSEGCFFNDGEPGTTGDDAYVRESIPAHRQSW